MGRKSSKKKPVSHKTGKPTKKEQSKIKEASRKKRKEDALEREAARTPQERENPITVSVKDGIFTFHGRSFYPTRDKNEALAPFGKILLQRGLQLHILPTEEQKNLIANTNGCARVARNEYLDKRIEKFETDRTTLSVAVFKKEYLPKLKEEKPWLKEVDKFALEAAIEAVDNAYTNFFNGNADFPKFVSKYKPNGNRYTTKVTNGNIALVEENGLPYIKLPKLGKVRFVLPKGQTVSGLFLPNTRITKATVIKDGKHYLVSLALETVVEKTVPLNTVKKEQIVAMDMGIRKFCDYGPTEKGYEHIEIRNGSTSTSAGCAVSIKLFLARSMTQKHTRVPKTGKKPSFV